MNEVNLLQQVEANSANSNPTICKYKFCMEGCICSFYQQNYALKDPNQVLYRAIIANNPNNPGFNMKEGVINFSQIQGIPISQICKVKICYQNEYMLINTLQIYSSKNQSKPVYLGVNQNDNATWFIKVIEAKLATEHNIRLNDNLFEREKISGLLFKKTTFGKWKKHQVLCQINNPKVLKFSQEYTNINSTSQIWTRFQLIKQLQIPCIVVKLWGALGKKQLAVPLPQLAIWIKSLCAFLS